MKLQEFLMEMPDFINKEMPIITNGTIRFYSIDTIERDFDLISKTIKNNEEFWTILKKDKSIASIGILSRRKEDNKLGLDLLGILDFKESPDFSFNRLINVNEKVLQVDSVNIYSDKFQGFGYLLYSTLVEYGYILVSDHTQYLGGKKLWEKISKLSNSNKYSVFIVNNGEVLLDDNGMPLEYNGSNLNDDEICGDKTSNINDSRRYVLLVMKKN